MSIMSKRVSVLLFIFIFSLILHTSFPTYAFDISSLFQKFISFGASPRPQGPILRNVVHLPSGNTLLINESSHNLLLKDLEIYHELHINDPTPSSDPMLFIVSSSQDIHKVLARKGYDYQMVFPLGVDGGVILAHPDTAVEISLKEAPLIRLIRVYFPEYKFRRIILRDTELVNGEADNKTAWVRVVHVSDTRLAAINKGDSSSARASASAGLLANPEGLAGATSHIQTTSNGFVVSNAILNRFKDRNPSLFNMIEDHEEKNHGGFAITCPIAIANDVMECLAKDEHVLMVLGRRSSQRKPGYSWTGRAS